VLLFFPFHREENFWLLLADTASNEVWLSQKVSFMDEATAITAASKAIQDIQEALGASPREIGVAVREAVDRLCCPDTAIRIRIRIQRYGDTAIFRKHGYGDTFIYV
jgi:hypothetical protein